MAKWIGADPTFGSSFKTERRVLPNNTKGRVRAFDARSGKTPVAFNTLPGPGELLVYPPVNSDLGVQDMQIRVAIVGMSRRECLQKSNVVRLSRNTMKLSAVVFLTMALAPLFVANVASAQTYPPPTWSPVMNELGSTTIHSGSYWAIGNNQRLTLSNTDLGALETINGGGQSNNLILPVSTLPASGSSWTCGAVGFATDFVESNQGSGIKGIGAQAAFNSPYPNLSLFETVFFNEDQCYGTGSGHAREYGIFLDTVNNEFYAYWGTNVNRPNANWPTTYVSQAQAEIGGGLYPDTLYNWYIYPVMVGSSCDFQIYITTTPGGTPWYAQTVPVSDWLVTGVPILTADPGFCTAITSDTGYISANFEPVPSNVSGSVPIGDFMHLNNLWGGGTF